MKRRIELRLYDKRDRRAVLGVFESNYPTYFLDRDQDWLKDTLGDPGGPAFVLAVDARVVGFGGYEIGEYYNKAYLTFGMVHAEFHKLRLGKLLLMHRMRHIARHAQPRTDYVFVDTTPQVAPFFERCGFERLAVWEKGYRSGFDLHELRFWLGEENRRRLPGRYAAALRECRRKVNVAAPGPGVVRAPQKQPRPRVGAAEQPHAADPPPAGLLSRTSPRVG